MGQAQTQPRSHGLSEALDIVHELEDDRVTSLMLFGSVARCEAGPKSDIDVVVVHEGPMPDDLADRVPHDVSIAFYGPSRLAAMPTSSPLFALHLAREGLVVQDSTGALTSTLARVRPLASRTTSRLAISTRHRLRELLAQPRGLYLDPDAASAELYALAKQGAMLLAARERMYEFNRHRALARAYDQVHLPIGDRRQIDDLEQIWHAKRCRAEDANANAPEDLHRSAEAVQTLLTALIP